MFIPPREGAELTVTNTSMPDSRRHRAPSLSAARPSGPELVGPIATIGLGIHGMAILGSSATSTVGLWALVALVGLVGVVSLRSVPSATTLRLRALATLAAAVWLMTQTGGKVSLFLLWLFVIVVIYTQSLSPSWLALLTPFVVAAAYAALPNSDPQGLPVSAVVSRSALLITVGLTVGTLAISSRRAIAIEQRFHVLVESAGDAIIAIDHNHRIALVNEQAEHIFGYRRSEVLGKRLTLLLPDRFGLSHDDHIESFLAGPEVRQTMSARQELSGRRSNGEEFPVEVTIAKFENDDGIAATAIIRDVSTSRATLAALQDREQELSALVKSKDTLIASISHEMRTPLTAVAGFASLLADRAADLTSDERAEMIQMISDQSADLSNIVDDLLVEARAKAGSLSVVHARLDLREEAAKVLAGWKQSANGVPELVGDSAPALGDPARIRQILRNLLSNAIRYGGETIHVSVSSDDAMAHVSVTDDGPGIAPGDQDRIFESYERAHNAGTLTASLGLGLSISKQLAVLMDGELSYDGEPGRCTFTLSLPALGGQA